MPYLQALLQAVHVSVDAVTIITSGCLSCRDRSRLLLKFRIGIARTK